MYDVFIEIGDHHFCFQSESESIRDYLQINFRLAEHPGVPDLIVFLEEGYGVPFVNWDVDAQESKNWIEYRRADYRLRVNYQKREAEVAVFDHYALKHCLMNLYSSYIVNSKWGLLIHSSCVLDGKNAFLFAGQSGAGKSTAAMLSKPRPILSDEATVVKIDRKHISVFDSPFRSDSVSSFTRKRAPLKGIQLLRQSSTIKRTKLGKSDSLLQLLDKVFYWPYCKEETEAIFSLCLEMANKVPVYELQFQKNPHFWEAIS